MVLEEVERVLLSACGKLRALIRKVPEAENESALDIARSPSPSHP